MLKSYWTAVEPPPSESPQSMNGARRWRLANWLWLASAVVLCTGLGVAPVSRSQEARVLETAREMLGSDSHNWIVPRVNGRVRLQKPPLAYWLTAFTYQALGVSEGAGRLPAAAAGTFTVGLTAAAAAWLFGRRAAFFAGAALAGSFLFFRHARLAETDVLATLFVTAACSALWRGYVLTTGGRDTPADTPPGSTPASGLLRSVAWFHASAVAIALAVLSKGPPAAYPVLFLVALAACERRWKPLARFVLSGAPLTAAVIALPWFLYVRQDPDYNQLLNDLRNSAGGGRGHSGHFLTYLPALFVATAPWSALWVIALAAAARQWRRDWRMRGLVAWVGSILVPLFFWGNKQIHYLMPVMPPLMVLVGWAIDEAIKSAPTTGAATAGLVRRACALTAIVLAAGAPGLVVAGRLERGYFLPADFATAALVVAGMAAVGWVYRRRGAGAGVTALAGVNVVLLAVLVGLWAPTLSRPNIRDISAAVVSKYGEGPFALVGKEDLPMVFNMRRVLPVVRTDAEIADLAARQPDVVVIEAVGANKTPRGAVVEEARFRDGETVYRVGRIDRTEAPAGAAAPARRSGDGG